MMRLMACLKDPIVEKGARCGGGVRHNENVAARARGSGAPVKQKMNLLF